MTRRSNEAGELANAKRLVNKPTDRDRRRAAYLALAASRPTLLARIVALNIGVPVVGIALLLAGGSSPMFGVVLLVGWAAANRWSDLVWRYRLRNLRRAAPQHFEQETTIVLSATGVDSDDDLGSKHHAWDAFTTVVHADDVVAFATSSLPTVTIGGLPSPDSAEVVQIAVELGGLDEYHPNPILWRLAVGLW